MTSSSRRKPYFRHECKKHATRGSGSRITRGMRQESVKGESVTHPTPSNAAAEPSLSAVSFDRAVFKERREEYVRELAGNALDKLADELSRGISDGLLTYLQTMGKFHRYSLNNQLLIALQKPDATRVAGFHAWKKFNRLVNKGEKGIVILAPVTRVVGKREEVQQDGSRKETAIRRVVNTKPVHVFDVSQTHGEPLPEAPGYAGQPGEYMGRLEKLYAKHGIKLDYVESLPGGAMGVSKMREVAVLAGLGPAEQFHVLVHELAHELLHKDRETRQGLSTTQKETEAEAVAFAVCSSVGLDPGTSASDYIKMYQGDRKLLMESLEAVRTTSADILDCLLASKSDMP